MRTCMDGCERLQASDVTCACLDAEVVMLSGYCLYGPNFTKQVIATAFKVHVPACCSEWRYPWFIHAVPPLLNLQLKSSLQTSLCESLRCKFFLQT